MARKISLHDAGFYSGWQSFGERSGTCKMGGLQKACHRRITSFMSFLRSSLLTRSALFRTSETGMPEASAETRNLVACRRRTGRYGLGVAPPEQLLC